MAQSQSPPPFVNSALIEKALQKEGAESTSVRSVEFRPVGVAGDNYSSALFRASVETEKGGKSLIIKALPAGDFQRMFLQQVGVFKLETLLLSELLPKMQRLLDGAAPGRFPPLAPRCPLHGSDPEEFIVLEDLAGEGFHLADRRRGLDLPHALLALRRLACFHAASAALLRQDPTIAEALPNLFSDDDPRRDMFRQIISGAFQMVASACRSWEGFPEHLADVLDANKEVDYRKIAEIHSYKPERFNVIAHGDFWINNMMFRYDKEEPQDVRLIDFQQSHVTSPAVDILYFFSTSLCVDVIKNDIDVLLREYHKTLAETLDLLVLEPYPWEDFQKDLDESGIFVTIGMCSLLPMIKTDKVPDVEKALTGGMEAVAFVYGSPAYQQCMMSLVPEFNRRGWIV